jgi:hypothetical protein
MRNHHPDLNNRLRSLRIELAEALVPIRGPLPPGIVKMLTELKASPPCRDRIRPDGGPTNPSVPTHATGLPSQYPPRPSRANVIQHEVTALNSYHVDDPFCDVVEPDQWGTLGNDSY